MTTRTLLLPRPAADKIHRHAKAKRKAATPDDDIHESQPTASGDRSLIRALGLKDRQNRNRSRTRRPRQRNHRPQWPRRKRSGTGSRKALGKLLESRLGAEVVYTRSDDTFIPLETRTAIANQEQADLFVSIHANSSNDPDARGVETYYLNFTSSPEALEVAARENAVSSKSIHELQDLVKKIALKEKIEESKEFASDVQTALHSGLSTKRFQHPQPRRKESSVHRPDRRQHAVDPRGNFFRQQSHRRTPPAHLRLPPENRRVSLSRYLKVCKRPGRSKSSQQAGQKRRPIRPLNQSIRNRNCMIIWGLAHYSRMETF